MRMLAGALLILAGVIPFCFGAMLQFAEWYSQMIWPLVLAILGGFFILFGTAMLAWGVIGNFSQHPRTSDRRRSNHKHPPHAHSPEPEEV